MPDITMCSRIGCPKKDSCYRFNAKPDHYQSYSDFVNTCNEETNYSMYWDMDINNKVLNKKKEVTCVGCGKDSTQVKKFVAFDVKAIRGKDKKVYLCKECIEAAFIAVNGEIKL